MASFSRFSPNTLVPVWQSLKATAPARSEVQTKAALGGQPLISPVPVPSWYQTLETLPSLPFKVSEQMMNDSADFM